VAAAAFLAGYYLTIVGSNVALALALHRRVGRVSARVQTGLLVATGALLAVYGAALVGRGAAELRTRYQALPAVTESGRTAPNVIARIG
jgi:hypothetical protein